VATAELARMAGEQEVALRALVTTEPVVPSISGTTDLRAALQLLASLPCRCRHRPAGEVPLPANTTAELLAVTKEALSNLRHAPGASACFPRCAQTSC
jgi:hypothetical protein